MKMYGVEEKLSTFLTLALDGGNNSTSCSGCFNPGKITHGTPWKGGWMGHRADLDIIAKRKMTAPARNQTLVVQPVTLLSYPCSYCSW